LTNSTTSRAFWSAFYTFNLAIMGGSVLPMPYAISKTGVLVGMLTMALVALCNDYTTCLTISAAYTTGLDSFEALAYWAGGPHWKVRGTAAGWVAAGWATADQQVDAVGGWVSAVPYPVV
jgi:amino acid permease